jgi:CRISPR system Cascade subunit CasE
MLLSRLILNPRSREARRDAASAYDLHRTLARGFETHEGENYRARHGVLFRVEPPSRQHPSRGPVVLVQSQTEPDWSRLPEDYLLDAEARPFEPAFQVGQALAFRLAAFPAKRDRETGKRVALGDEPAEEPGALPPALDWLARKGAAQGFAVVQVVGAPVRVGRPGFDPADKASYPFDGFRFDGVLRVKEPMKLVETVRKGIGPAKAFGFGLLSLAPAL